MNAVEKNEVLTILREKTEKQRSSLDQALLKICALGVPITLYVKIHIPMNPEPQYENLFTWFAFCWVITLAATVSSYVFSEMGYKKTTANVRNNVKKDGWATGFTTWVNRLALLAFFLGLICLVVFAFFNVF